LTVREIALPGVCSAAAGGAAARCIAGGRLLTFAESGERLGDVPAPERIRQLASTSDSLIALQDEHVAWLDRKSGRVVQRAAVGGDAQLIGAVGSVWVVDRRHATARRVHEGGVLGPRRSTPGIDRAAADGDNLWWLDRDAATLRDFDREVELGSAARGHGGITVCAGSVWVSGADGLCRVGTWRAARGAMLAAPFGPADYLACARGALVGASGRHGVFALDPAADADVRLLAGADEVGPTACYTTVGDSLWAFLENRAAARLIRIRQGAGPQSEPRV